MSAKEMIETIDLILKHLDELEEKDKEIERLHSIIKEVREYIERNKQKIIPAYGDNYDDDFDIALDEEDIDNILKILERESK